MISPYQLVSDKLQQGMVHGEMHLCLRDVGRLAGGYAATGALGIRELMDLADHAERLSINGSEGREKWEKSVSFGRSQPVYWDEQSRDEGHALAWDATIGREEMRIVDPSWVSDLELVEPEAWSPVSDLTRYLQAVFDSEDHVGYVTESWFNEEAQRHLPRRGCYDRTAGQLIELLGKCGDDIGSVIGDTDPAVGGWIRFNPLDGAGVKDANVTHHRFALIECDQIPVERQFALIKELELPVAAMVHSGGKSVHAIVRVDAGELKEYRERVDFLYEVCKRNGLTCDTQNKNPSRLSRLPGVMRNERKQWLVSTNVGKTSWQEWRDWIEDINDDLPDIEEITIGDEEPELAPELISGVLREGHKLLLAGPSKAGKSFALIQLAIAMSQGKEWFGWPVKQGRCLYVNLELDKMSADHRFWKIHQVNNLAPVPGMIDVWNLRGNATSLDRLTPKLIRRAQKKNYKMVIIDPIYKVLTGDENSAAEMAAFCNQFDRICLQLGAATVYCHHHSKGAQGQKSSKDRSSGSGVFARDPDAIIDMIELHIEESRRELIVNRWQCDAVKAVLNRECPDWDDKVGQDDTLVANKLIEWARKAGLSNWVAPAADAALARAQIVSGWRLETTLREFATAKPRNAFFSYPVHIVDSDEMLKDAKADGEEAPWEKQRRDSKQKNEERKQEANDNFINALEIAKDENGIVKVAAVAEVLGIARQTVHNRIKKFPNYTINNGIISEKTTTTIIINE